MRNDVILRVLTKMLIPFGLLFALYVQFHGEYGPGGGFQAGVIIAGMIIVYALVFGLKAAQLAVPRDVLDVLVPLGVLIYAGTGVAGMLLGANFLGYAPFASNPAKGHEWGIIIVEFGVLVTVAATMLAIFYAFAERGRQ